MIRTFSADGDVFAGDQVSASDPDSDEFCIIEPGNRYLAGCGRLGEVTCDGTPMVGRLWRDALGWSLVWDQDERIAIQAPERATKIAWGDWHDSTTRAEDRFRFDLVVQPLGGLRLTVVRVVRETQVAMKLESTMATEITEGGQATLEAFARMRDASLAVEDRFDANFTDGKA